MNLIQTKCNVMHFWKLKQGWETRAAQAQWMTGPMAWGLTGEGAAEIHRNGVWIGELELKDDIGKAGTILEQRWSRGDYIEVYTIMRSKDGQRVNGHSLSQGGVGTGLGRE